MFCIPDEKPVRITDENVLNSPFVDLTSPITDYEKVKMIFLFPIAIIKLLLCVKCFILMYILTIFEKVTKINSERAIHLTLKAMVLFSGTWVTVKGFENLNNVNGNCVIVYNHITFMDQFIIGSVEFIAGVTIHAYRKMPIIGPCFEWLGTIFFNHKEGVTSKIVVRLHNSDKYRFKLAIAPEGTLTNGKALVKFKTGAFVAKVPVLPVILKYPHRFFNPAWTIDEITLIAYRYFTQFVNFATVEYLPVVEPEENEEPKEYAERVRNIMAKALNVPMVEQDGSDKLELIKKYTMSDDRSYVSFLEKS